MESTAVFVFFEEWRQTGAASRYCQYLCANLIEKYAVALNLDALPDLVMEESMPEKVEADEMIHESNIESAKAA